MREAEGDTRVRTSRCLSYCAMNIHPDNALFPPRRPAPSLSQLARPPFVEHNSNKENQTKSGAGEPSSAPHVPLASPPLAIVLGFSEIDRKGATCCETRQVHPFVIPAWSVKMILIKRRRGVKDRSALPSCQMERVRISLDLSRLDQKKCKNVLVVVGKRLLIGFRIPHQSQRAGHFFSTSHLCRCMRNVKSSVNHICSLARAFLEMKWKKRVHQKIFVLPQVWKYFPKKKNNPNNLPLQQLV